MSEILTDYKIGALYKIVYENHLYPYNEKRKEKDYIVYPGDIVLFLSQSCPVVYPKIFEFFLLKESEIVCFRANNDYYRFWFKKIE